jgi:hypothetical protein
MSMENETSVLKSNDWWKVSWIKEALSVDLAVRGKGTKTIAKVIVESRECSRCDDRSFECLNQCPDEPDDVDVGDKGAVSGTCTAWEMNARIVDESVIDRDWQPDITICIVDLKRFIQFE